MKRHAAFAMLVLGLTAGVSAVHAADLIPLPPEQPVEYVPASGWYIRGDVGYVFKTHSEGDWDFYNQFPGVEGIDDTFGYQDFDLDDAASFGAGVGYRFTDNFRVDATVDYFSPDLDGDRHCPSYVAASQFGQAPPNIGCHYKDSADVDVWTALANAYVDLPSFYSVTPYIGAGIGAAYVDYGSLKSEQCGNKCGASDNIFFKHEGEDDWRFASALTAGVAVDLTQQLALDVGYRYTRIFEGDAFGYDKADKSFGAGGTQIRDDGFDIQAVRAGLRYSFF